MAEPVSQNGNSETTELDSKIIRQIEYYFGDHNLARDKFMKNAVKTDDGWFPLDTLLTFNRLKSLSTDHEVILSALAKSQSGLMEISEDRKKVRRKPDNPIPDYSEEWKSAVDLRTVYVKGFPCTLTLDELLEFFQQHGNLDNVYMRRTLGKTKTFKGSVFATFKTKEAADEFLKKDNVSFKETELKRETKDSYFKRKQEEIKALQEERQKKKELKKQAEEEDKNKTDEHVQDDKPKKGCFLHLHGFKNDISRENIKEIFDTHSRVSWILFKRGESEAWVQFAEENTAATTLQKVLDVHNGKLEIQGIEITGDIVETEEEEIKIWENIKQSKQEIFDRKRNKYGFRNQRGGRGRGRGQGRGGRYGGRREHHEVKFQGKKRKFSDSDDDEATKSKEVKVESEKEPEKKSSEAMETTTESTTAVDSEAKT